MKRRLLLPIVLGAVALGLAAQTQAMSAPKLKGTVGPGYTISLKDSTGKKVTSLKAGKYTFVVHDRSNIHNWHLTGPVSKEITTVGFQGTKTVTLRLKPGKYTFVCDPHASAMRGTFTVTR